MNLSVPDRIPEVRSQDLTINRVTVSAERKSVRSAEGLPLLHPAADYTLNYIPSKK